LSVFVVSGDVFYTLSFYLKDIEDNVSFWLGGEGSSIYIKKKKTIWLNCSY
jgi:hypothetical protein